MPQIKDVDSEKYYDVMGESGAAASVPFAELGDQTLVYNPDGTLNYVQTVIPKLGTYRQTFGYTNGLVTSISRWVRQ